MPAMPPAGDGANGRAHSRSSRREEQEGDEEDDGEVEQRGNSSDTTAEDEARAVWMREERGADMDQRAGSGQCRGREGREQSAHPQPTQRRRRLRR